MSRYLAGMPGSSIRSIIQEKERDIVRLNEQRVQNLETRNGELEEVSKLADAAMGWCSCCQPMTNCCGCAVDEGKGPRDL